MATSAYPVEREGLLLGADVGGTATRVAVATAAGEVLARATEPAGNPNAVGLEVSARRIRTAVEHSLAQIGADSSVVRAAVLGLAGGARADEAFLRSALPLPPRTPVRLVSDLSVAFCAATPEPEGYVLVAGTGAVAGRIVDGDLQERRDGWGWLLGDEGSGFWLGREAVRATLTRLQAGEERLGPLTEAVVEVAGTRDPVALVQLCYANPPVWLSTFAHLVSRHVEDPAAAAIAERSAELLLGTLLALDPNRALPVVLAGSVATQPGPIRDALIHRLADQLDRPPLTSESGVVGALWLAACAIGHDDKATHARLTWSARRTRDTVI